MFKLKMVEKPELLNLKTNVEFPPVYVQTDHSKLENLDYKNSGHIGFASSNDLEKKVDKIEGKGLSTNDYTNDEKNKLAELENYTLPIASNTKLGGIKIGENLTITEDGKLSATGGGGGENITIIDGNIYTQDNPFNFDTSVIQYGDKFKFINAPAYYTINNNAPAANYYSEIAQNFILEAINIPTNPTEQNQLKLYWKEYYSYTSTYYENYINIYININGNGTIASLTQQPTFSTGTTYNIYGEWRFYKLPKTYSDPTDQNGLTRKGYVDSLPTKYAGYDATKTQVLKNINGVLTWQDE